MSGFSAEWLALREPFDAAARSAALVRGLRAHVAAGTEQAPLTIVDLGAGAGSNLRYLAPLLGGTQRWRLVDHDGALLDAGFAATRAWAERRGALAALRPQALTIEADGFRCEVSCERHDLRSLDDVALPACGLVTAAALLDLVSAEWLEALAERCAAAKASVCFGLTYDGRAVCAPAEPEDGDVLELFNRHQLGDKGFGTALGPNAAAAAQAAFERHGYTVAAHPSDWVIGAADRTMQIELLGGWRAAATELALARSAALADWHARRRAHVDDGCSTLRVGHVDIVGWL